VYRDPVCAFEMTFEVILDEVFVPLLEDEGLIPMDFSNACIAVSEEDVDSFGSDAIAIRAFSEPRSIPIGMHAMIYSLLCVIFDLFGNCRYLERVVNC